MSIAYGSMMKAGVPDTAAKALSALTKASVADIQLKPLPVLCPDVKNTNRLSTSFPRPELYLPLQALSVVYLTLYLP